MPEKRDQKREIKETCNYCTHSDNVCPNDVDCPTKFVPVNLFEICRDNEHQHTKSLHYSMHCWFLIHFYCHFTWDTSFHYLFNDAWINISFSLIFSFLLIRQWKECMQARIPPPKPQVHRDWWPVFSTNSGLDWQASW